MWVDRLNLLRKQSGLSLDELSKLSGVPKGTLSKITAGITSNPGIETIRNIVHAMGFTLKDLEDEDQLPPDKLNNETLSSLDRITATCERLNEAGREKVACYAEDMELTGKYKP